jgi:hypothetical protein
MAWTLRLTSDSPTAAGEPIAVGVRIDVEGRERLSRHVRLDVAPSPREMAQLRWYLEDFPNHPYDPAPELAEAARTRMRQLGTAMFMALRSAVSDPLLDWCLGDGLPETSIEVVGSPGSIAWELLHDPDTGRVPLVHAKRMVRLALAGPDAPTGQLSPSARVLLVVSRPAGIRDVRFQSVARPLLSALSRHGAFDIVVLRPPTYPALLKFLSEAKNTGHPFDLVHFDGHGLVHESKGHLVFEAESSGQAGTWIPGVRLGRDLAAANVRVAVLNACRSADVGAGLEATTVAFRTLAEELVLAGLGGVLAMQYDVRVDTAARFVTPLYLALAAGRPLGESAMAARRELYDAMLSMLADGAAVATDDWFVPVVYEAARPHPLTPGSARAPTALPETGKSAGAPVYDPSFHGRDDVLLQLDRAFDKAQVVDLCGLAGGGKTAAARQFARWYAATGGVQGDVVVVEIGLAGIREATDRIVAALGGSVEEAVRRFSKQPGLLIVDDVNAPHPDERTRMNALFAKLTEAGTRILLTSHAAFWVEGAERIRLGSMEDADMLAILRDQLGTQLDAQSVADWRPVLDLANGNPLALLTLVEWSRALPDFTGATLRTLVDDVLSGDSPPLPESARRSLEVWSQQFIQQEGWQRLALLLHRQRYADINELLTLGKPETPEHLAELEAITGDEWGDLFIRLSVGGLMWQANNTYFELHPMFAPVMVLEAGRSIEADRLLRIERSFAFLMNSVGSQIIRDYRRGHERKLTLKWAGSEEHNLRHALELARRRGWWELIEGTMGGLNVQYQSSGRQSEWAGIVNKISQHVLAPNGGPVKGCERLWGAVCKWLKDMAVRDGDLQAAYSWADRVVTYERATGNQTRVASLLDLASVERDLDDPRCIDHLLEAQRLVADNEAQRSMLAAVHFHLGLTYQRVTAVKDLKRAYDEYGRCLALQPPDDRLNRAKCLSQSAETMLQLLPGLPLGPDSAALADEAMRLSVMALQLFTADSVVDQAVVHARIGRICRITGNWAKALEHDIASRSCYERGGDTFGQASSRLNVALDLQGLGRIDDARVYAAAADQVFNALGKGGHNGRTAAQDLLEKLGA